MKLVVALTLMMSMISSLITSLVSVVIPVALATKNEVAPAPEAARDVPPALSIVVVATELKRLMFVPEPCETAVVPTKSLSDTVTVVVAAPVAPETVRAEVVTNS